MLCQNCGNEINDNAAVCPKCGAAVEMQSAPVYSAYPAAETPKTNGAAGYAADVKKRPKMSKKTVVAVVCAVAALVIIILIAVLASVFSGSGTIYDEYGDACGEIQYVYNDKNVLQSRIKTSADEDETNEQYNYYDEEGRIIESSQFSDGDLDYRYTYEYGNNGQFTECQYIHDNLLTKLEGEMIRGAIFSGKEEFNGKSYSIYSVEKQAVNVYRQYNSDDGHYKDYYFDGFSDRVAKEIFYREDGTVHNKTEYTYEL